MNDLSVVVITRNRLEKLKRCILSIKSSLPEAQIFVVDNGSTDGSVGYLKDERIVETVFSKTNMGVAAARNVGISKASNRFVMLIDDDAWIGEIDIAGIQRYFDSDDSVGIIAPRVLYPDGSIQESIRKFPTLLSVLWRGTFLHKIFPTAPWYQGYISHETEKVHKTDWAIGACQIVRREVFELIGSYNEKYFFGYEDADFCRRTSRNGYSTVYWPHTRIYHEYARSSAKGLNRHLFSHIASIIRFFCDKKGSFPRVD